LLRRDRTELREMEWTRKRSDKELKKDGEEMREMEKGKKEK
jgi:hypothetical protein